MINYGVGIIGYILTFLTVIFAVFTCIISLGVILVIFYHLYHQHRHLKREEKICFLLHSQIYSSILIFTIVFISINIQTLIGNLYGKNFDSPSCIFQGYCILASAYVMYCGFVVQALFRLFRIVYPNHRRLQSYWIFIVSVPVAAIQGSLVLSPLIFWHDIVYLPTEYYCLLLPTNIRAELWSMLTCYMVPQLCLLMIQVRITIFLRQQSSHLPAAIKQRQQRDLEVIRRIFINVGVLIITGLPAIVISFMALVTGTIYPLGRRITSITVGVSFAILCIEMICITPQLKRLILRREQQNRVATIEHGLQMRTISTAQ